MEEDHKANIYLKFIVKFLDQFIEVCIIYTAVKHVTSKKGEKVEFFKTIRNSIIIAIFLVIVNGYNPKITEKIKSGMIASLGTSVSAV